MARYFFDFKNSGARPDAEGSEFASREGARREAPHAWAEVAGSRFLRAGAGDQTVSLSVRDEAGTVVFTGFMSIETSHPAHPS